MAFCGMQPFGHAQLLNVNPGLPFERTMFIEKEQFLTSVNSTVPAVTLPVAGGTHLHVWLYRAQDRSGVACGTKTKPCDVGRTIGVAWDQEVPHN